MLPTDLIPMDNVGCFLRQMGYAALTPGKHDFYFGPDRLRMMAKFLYGNGEKPGPALLAGNLSIATSAPDAYARLPLYAIERHIKSKHPAAPGHRQIYSVMPPVHGDDPPPGITFPDVVLPSYRRIQVDNAYFTIENGKRVIAADLPGKWKLVPKADKGKAADSKMVLSKTPALALMKKGDPPGGPGTPLKDVTLQLRVDHLWICPNSTRDPNSFAVPGADPCWEVDPQKAGEGIYQQPDGTEFATGSITFEMPKEKLEKDTNYAACMHLVATEFDAPEKMPEYYCQPFYVAQPFFSYERGKGDDQPKPDDPFVVTRAGGETVAIFGLLDPAMQGNIGRLNYGWWNQNPRFETAAQISGLADALKQALMRCDLEKACREAQHRILLAQMAAASAAQFLSSLQEPLFELVVTQTDPSNPTAAGSVKREFDDDSSSPRFVAVPDDFYAGGAITVQLRQAAIQKVRTLRRVMPPDPKAVTVTWTMTNSLIVSNPTPIPTGEPERKSCAEVPRSLRCLALETLAAHRVGAMAKGAVTTTQMDQTWSSAQILRRLALLLMQQRVRADVSMMQTRDTFRPETYGAAVVTPENLQELLDRLFWKGDYALSVPVTGATLTAILAASANYAVQEANPTNIDLEKGRTLQTLGVFKEAAEQNWTVNGNLVDPAKVYEVAMTDYLALGDTGYTDLKTPLVPFPYRIKDFKNLESISGLVCREIVKNTKDLKDAPCHKESLKSENHLDLSTDSPADVTRGLTAPRQSNAYVNEFYRWARFTNFYAGQNAAELASAQKPFWSLELEKGDFGLNASVHQHFATPVSQTQALKNFFAGITVAPVTAPNSYSTTFDDRLRLRYSTKRFDVFLLHESAYSYTRTQDSSDDKYARSLSQNLLAGEGGLLLRLWPWTKRFQRRWDLLLSGRIDSQVLSPREDLTLATGTLPGTFQRAVDGYGKAGFRYTDERSWLEVGAMKGTSFVNPYEVVFQSGSSTVTVPLNPGCQNCGLPYPKNTPAPTASSSFLDWVSYLSSPPDQNGTGFLTTSSKFVAHYTRRPLTGLFLNFSYNVPLPIPKVTDWTGAKPVALLLENTGRFWLNNRGDLATQTRLFDKLAASLVVPVVGNLSLKPEVDVIYYQNKVKEYPFHSFNIMGTLSYTFARRSGQPWSRVWRYASPAPSTSVPASGR